MGGAPFTAEATATGRHKNRLFAALALTTTFMVVEVAGGLWTGSLALLANAAHMLTDAGGLTLVLIAIRFAEQPKTPSYVYGWPATRSTTDKNPRVPSKCWNGADLIARF